LRLGAKEAFVIYRRSKEEMPAFTEGIEAVQSEGAKLVLLTAPTRIVGSNKVEGLECLKMSLGELDASGRRSPVPVPRSEFDIEVDTVVIAIGEAPDTAYWTEIGLTAEGTLKADAGNLTTSVRGIFAGGDAVTGPSSVVEAFASGKRAALSIDCYLKGGAPESLRYGKPVIVGKHPKEGIEKKPRQAAPVSPFTKMKGDFNELKSGFSEETAMREGSRCMSCGSKAFAAYLENCMTCYNCEMGCPYQAVNVDPFRKVMPVLLKIPGDTKNYDVLYTARARGARS
ncbi:MAG: FAD-dependent oxidoreductase, partial [Dehalococcoidia bacterium]|nr:FAD-dependent oxidoreductase [Dehalococcoidia bacterium]